MLLSRNITELLNKQLVHEGENTQKYMAMAAMASKHNLEGFEGFFKKQAEEERGHYDMVFKYLSDKGAAIEIGTLNGVSYKPTGDVLADMQGLAKKAYAIELETTKRLYMIFQEALDDGDFGTVAFLNDEMIMEQKEEEAKASKMEAEVMRCESYGDINAMDCRLRG